MVDWWTTRSRREQILLGALAGLLLIFILWFGVASPLRGAARDAEDHLARALADEAVVDAAVTDRKSTRLNSSHVVSSYAVFLLKKKKNKQCPNHCFLS